MDTTRCLKVSVKDLRIGMYVVELDRPWLETPFLIQGFVIRSVQELETISDLCSHVYVDTGRSVAFHRNTRPASPTAKPLARDKVEKLVNVRVTTYADATNFKDELSSVRRVYSDYEETVARFYDDVRVTQKIDVGQLQKPVNDIVDSVIRNPDACLLLAKLRRKGDYTYNHALGCSIWAAALGRQLGLPKKVMFSVAMGAMLLDVGKLSLSDRLLNKPTALTSEELELTKSHVAKGLKMLESTRGGDRIVFQMLMAHHERHNGKGYPRGMKDKTIPVYGRIAGIVDTYDALINDKPYRQGLAPSEAIKILYSVRDVDFQAELVEEFIQVLGVYPAGSMVELSNGEVGIVVSEHRQRRLRPKILICLDADKNRLAENRYVDLFEVRAGEDGKPLDIQKSLTPGEYGLDPDDMLI